ncbi:DUF11 domain-containing protein [Sphingopyxis alaskensis]|jgi:uncharacterized repeat protein (TIGR01451 family)|uniref:DUF11 domain-containing protein n=1 Tax=Sphingopyxis alaskensis (strain DSM 13593 / LMG 18877 / RB2256) TaxID=317655 RepID=Q1GTI1_SPHAL|nr:DUF11 domain-containing protein [Sphingopyxis alaskensis]ABF53041.1 protein of unknown function DUF11 [Sphingopyxis alaskensis RB2256]MCM3420069.1 DUF11 domain-containing protein [Sphingopyxis alaskensis]
MTSKLNTVGFIGLAAISSLAATSALAAGTTAGTTITNTATVDFQVGGVAQVQQSASDNFTVDRKINLLVEEVGTVTTNVVPGQTNAVTTFQLTNSSNEVLDFALVASQIAGGTAAHGGTDSFDATNVRIYRDNISSGTVGSWDAADTLISGYIDELVVDTAIRLFVVADIPAALANNAVAGVTLRATAREGGTAGSQGAAITETTGANTAGKDTVFADTAGVTGDAGRDGSHSDNDDYTVQTATLTVTKTSRVISDPFNNTTNPKLIPGAVVEYCIAVANSGSADATSVAINDPVPGQLSFSAGTIRLGGTVTAGTCNADGAVGGSYSAPNVSGTIATIAAGATRTLVFRATVN